MSPTTRRRFLLDMAFAGGTLSTLAFLMASPGNSLPDPSPTPGTPPPKPPVRPPKLGGAPPPRPPIPSGTPSITPTSKPSSGNNTNPPFPPKRLPGKIAPPKKTEK